MDERYLIISSDCHAGLPCEEYRPYLDPAHLDAFDDFLAERAANRNQALALNYDYIHEWESTNEEGLRGAFDSEQRDKELDADGVSGEVIFPDSDAITGMESPPFGAGLSAGAIADPELAFAGARAHNRFLADLVAQSPARRAGVALVPVSHDVERGVREAEWAAEHGLRGVMIPTMWHDRLPYNDPTYDRFWAACAANHLPVHTHSGEAPRDEYGDNIGIYLAEVYWWAVAPDVAPALLRRVRAVPRPVVRRHGGGRVLGAGPEVEVGRLPRWRPHHEEDGRRSWRASSRSRRPSTSGPTSSSARRRCRPRRSGVATSSAATSAMWGTDYPHPEGTWPHTAERLRRDFASVPVDDCQKLFGATAARVYGFDVDALRAIADRIGPTPEDLGQDPTRRSDPAEIASRAVVEGGAGRSRGGAAAMTVACSLGRRPLRRDLGGRPCGWPTCSTTGRTSSRGTSTSSTRGRRRT